MKFSVNWLREMISLSIENSKLTEQLTMAGLEVESITPAVAKFSKVFTAKVLDVQLHPDAQKLKVCKVQFNNEVLQIVCGDPAVSKETIGSVVALAINGASLQNGVIKIKNSKLRGVESQGMLCSKSELGLSDVKNGIWILPNETPLDVDIFEYLNLNDEIVEVSITPNRGDCLSLRGIAREIAVINQLEIDLGHTTEIENNHTVNPVKINISDPMECPRYAGRVIKNINNKATTPIWMQEKLRRSGIKSIYPIVDITNYVMLELGQPMHAFDLDRLSDEISVRHSKEGEKLLLLDGNEITLKKEDLVIANKDHPIALAGVMGGQSTAISEVTENVFLESAFFTPQIIAGRARKYGLFTDSAQRFERGVDPMLTKRAIERATELLLEIMATPQTKISDIHEEIAHDYFKNHYIKLRHSRIKRVLGIEIDSKQVNNILSRLGLELINVENTADPVYEYLIPSHRFDLNIEVDLLEELARVYGYNNIPNITPVRALEIMTVQPMDMLLNTIRDGLSSRGYHEAINYSFTDHELQEEFYMGSHMESSVKLVNPISSELSELRQSLCPGLIKNAEYNFSRQAQEVKLYEIGKCFNLNPDNSVSEELKLAGILAGARTSENWHDKTIKVDFYDAKGDLEVILHALGMGVDDLNFIAFDDGQAILLKENNVTKKACMGMHPGQTAFITHKNKVIGWVGKIHPKISKKTNINESVILFELSLEQLKVPSYTYYRDISKMPMIKRDLAFLFKLDIKVQQLFDIVKNVAGDLLKSLEIFDVYQGEGIPQGYKNIAFSMVFQHQDKTLVDEEIVAMMKKIVDSITKNLFGQLRE